MTNTLTGIGAALLLTGLMACSSTGDSVAGAPEVHDPDEVSCRYVAKTGTRIGSKVCKTNRAWAESASRGREYKDRISRSASQQQNMPGQGN